MAPGYLIYGRQGSLLAQRFDARTLRLSGEAITLAERIYYFNGPAMAGFSASQAGVVSYEKLRHPSRVAWLDRSGRQVDSVGLEGIVGNLRVSPNGRMVAASVQDEKLGTSDIWLYDLARKLPMRLTLDVDDEQVPVWSADGTKIIFRGDRFGPPDLFEIRASSPGKDSTLLRRPGVQHPEDVSPDGRYLVFTEWSRQTDGNLWLLPLSGKGEPVPLAQTPSYEAGARFSPDGRWVAFVSNESGAREIYLMPADGAGERIRISSGGGGMPRWRRDGRELFFLAGGGWLAAVAVRPGANPDPGAPSLLFPLEGDVRDYDVDLSGERFLVDVGAGRAGAHRRARRLARASPEDRRSLSGQTRGARTTPCAPSRDPGTGRETSSRRGNSSRPACASPGSSGSVSGRSSSHSMVLPLGRQERRFVVAPVNGSDRLAADGAPGSLVPVDEDVAHQARVRAPPRSGRGTPGRSAPVPATGCRIPGGDPARRRRSSSRRGPCPRGRRPASSSPDT